MLKIIRRASTAPSTTIYVCILCQRNSTPSPSIIRTASTATKPITKAQAPPELVKELRAELEAHRQGLQKKKIPTNVPQDRWRKEAPANAPSTSAGGAAMNAGKRKDIPKAPPIRRRLGNRVQAQDGSPWGACMLMLEYSQLGRQSQTLVRLFLRP